MGSTRKGMLNVLIAAVLWGVQVFARCPMEQSRMSSVAVPDDDTFVIRHILVTFSFMHGDKIFSILKKPQRCTGVSLIFRGSAHRSANLPAYD